MTKVERVQKAFRREPVDKVPVSFWYHFLGEDRYQENYVASHYRLYKETDVDFMKLMNDAYFQYPIGVSIVEPADWRQLRPQGKNSRWVQGQAEYAARINEKLNGEIMTFWTHLAPFSNMRFFIDGDLASAHMKEDPDSVMEGMKAVTQDVMDTVEACLTKGGCSGAYFGLHSADVGRFTRDEYDKWIKPFDLQVCAVMNEYSDYNIAHMCGWAGVKNNLDYWLDYPLQLVHWAANVEDVDWAHGAEFFGERPRMGGFDSTEDGILYKGGKAQVKAEAKRLLSVSGTQGILLGGDCTVPSDISHDHIRWVVEASQAFSTENA